MFAEAHKKFRRVQHAEIYLLDLKVQYKHKMKLPLDMISKHVFCTSASLTNLITNRTDNNSEAAQERGVLFCFYRCDVCIIIIN